MAKNRRRSFWKGLTWDDYPVEIDGLKVWELMPSAWLDSEEEGTFTRLRGRIGIGSDAFTSGPPPSFSAAITNAYVGFMIESVGAGVPSPYDEPGDDRWLGIGFLRSAYIAEEQVVWDSDSNTANTQVVIRNQPGPWELWDFDLRSQRKLREGQALYAAVHTSGSSNGVSIHGFARALIKAR